MMWYENTGFLILMFIVGTVWIWVLRGIYCSVRQARRQYPYPSELVELMKKDVQKAAYSDGNLGDAFSVRHIILNVVTDYDEIYPAVDAHRNKIFYEIEKSL